MITVVHDGWVYRWSPAATFVAAWTTARVDEHVPDDMVEIPDWVNRSQVDHGVLTALITHGLLAAVAGPRGTTVMADSDERSAGV